MIRVANWFIASLAVLATGCASLPSLEGRTETTAITKTEDTRLGRGIPARAKAHPGQAGIHPLPDPRDAFAARVLLAGAAEKSIDVQYFIWHGDQAGYLLFEALWRAGERGVRVRMLLDDANTAGLDPTVAALDAHPNIEVRLYNPFANRGGRWRDFLADFERVNRRMHNKSFTADNQVTIVGGRNVGNEYYGVGSGVVFADLDVIAVGSVVREVSSAFDLYWNSPSAYPAVRVVGDAHPDAAATLQSKFEEVRADPESRAYVDAVRETTLIRQLLDGDLPIEWTTARVFRDDPAKTLDTGERTELLLFTHLMQSTGRPQTSFHLISPYFVPGKEGAESLAALAQSGVKVRVLTNSLAATDVTPVHAGYSKHRKKLLRAGVQLYELKPSADVRKPEGEKKHGGSSGASLHAKTFAIDGKRVFVGSFNFDQRSAHLNTEMGLLIDSPALAQHMETVFANEIPKGAYQVRVAAGDDDLEWIEQTPSGEIRHDSEPGVGFLRGLWVGFMSLLPIDWLL